MSRTCEPGISNYLIIPVNGGWVILELINWLINQFTYLLIDSFIDWEKMRVNFQVFLEPAHPAFLTT